MKTIEQRYLGVIGLLSECSAHLEHEDLDDSELADRIEDACNDAAEDHPIVVVRTGNRIEIQVR